MACPARAAKNPPRAGPGATMVTSHLSLGSIWDGLFEFRHHFFNMTSIWPGMSTFENPRSPLTTAKIEDILREVRPNLHMACLGRHGAPKSLPGPARAQPCETPL